MVRHSINVHTMIVYRQGQPFTSFSMMRALKKKDPPGRDNSTDMRKRRGVEQPQPRHQNPSPSVHTLQYILNRMRQLQQQQELWQKRLLASFQQERFQTSFKQDMMDRMNRKSITVPSKFVQYFEFIQAHAPPSFRPASRDENLVLWLFCDLCEELERQRGLNVQALQTTIILTQWDKYEALLADILRRKRRKTESRAEYCQEALENLMSWCSSLEPQAVPEEKTDECPWLTHSEPGTKERMVFRAAMPYMFAKIETLRKTPHLPGLVLPDSPEIGNAGMVNYSIWRFVRNADLNDHLLLYKQCSSREVLLLTPVQQDGKRRLEHYGVLDPALPAYSGCPRIVVTDASYGKGRYEPAVHVAEHAQFEILLSNNMNYDEDAAFIRVSI